MATTANIYASLDQIGKCLYIYMLQYKLESSSIRNPTSTNWKPVYIRIPISTRTNQDIQICTRRILDPTNLSVGFRILLNLMLSMILDITELKNIKICKICEI